MFNSGAELIIQQWHFTDHSVVALNRLFNGQVKGRVDSINKVFIIYFREKCSKQNMKNIFRENVFVYEDFSLNREENELHRKYTFFRGSTENTTPILEIGQN